MTKGARIYQVDKRNGKNESWTYFVPGQSANSVLVGAEQQHVAVHVSMHGWCKVFVALDNDGVYFSTKINGKEWNWLQGDEGYQFLISYMQPEYDAAYRSYCEM